LKTRRKIWNSFSWYPSAAHQQQRLQTNVSFLVVDSKVALVEEELEVYNNSNKEPSLATF